MALSVSTQKIVDWVTSQGSERDLALLEVLLSALRRYGLQITRKASLFQFVVGERRLGVYVIPPWCGPWRNHVSAWLFFLAHETIHAMGHVRGTLPFPGVKMGGRFVSTDTEERIAEHGAVVVCRELGVEVDESDAELKGEPSADEWVEIRERVGMVVGEKGDG